ncbi:MAG: cysteine synthase A, partial [Acidimicrobiaceae bacterium]|nr:cysteine synthase A [Acidimicrobiaceae bacterium]
MEVADSVLDLIGNTPLVRMRRAIPEAGCELVAKLE